MERDREPQCIEREPHRLALLAGLGEGSVRAPRVTAVPGGLEVRAEIGEGALALLLRFSSEPGRGVHLDVTVIDVPGPG